MLVALCCFCFILPHLVYMVASIYKEGSRGSQPAEPGDRGKQSVAGRSKFETVAMYSYEIGT